MLEFYIRFFKPVTLCILVFIVFADCLQAQTYRTRGSGIWGDPIWQEFDGPVPGDWGNVATPPPPGSEATIMAGHTVTANSSFIVNDLIIDGTLTIETTDPLEASNKLTLNSSGIIKLVESATIQTISADLFGKVVVEGAYIEFLKFIGPATPIIYEGTVELLGVADYVNLSQDIKVKSLIINDLTTFDKNGYSLTYLDNGSLSYINPSGREVNATSAEFPTVSGPYNLSIQSATAAPSPFIKITDSSRDLNGTLTVDNSWIAEGVGTHPIHFAPLTGKLIYKGVNITTGNEWSATIADNYLPQDIVLDITGNINFLATRKVVKQFTINRGSIFGTSLQYVSNATLIYNSTGNRTSGLEFPQSSGPDNVDIRNNITLTLDSSKEIESLILTSGKVQLGTYNLTVQNNITGSSNGNFVITNSSGQLTRFGTSPVTLNFPIGSSSSDYAPADISLNSGSGNISLAVVKSKSISNNSTTGFLSKYWVLNTDISSINYSGTFTYKDGDINAPEANIGSIFKASSTWAYQAEANTTSNTISVTNLTQAGDITGGNICDHKPFSIASATPTNATCFGYKDGSIVTQLSGGTSPFTYKYAFNGGADTTISAGNPSSLYTYASLKAGNFILKISDVKGCNLTSSTISITQFPSINLPNPTIQKAISCSGGSDGEINVAPTGGTAPYTFEWKKGSDILTNNTENITGLSAGNYEVRVTDSQGCPSNNVTYRPIALTDPAKVNLTHSVTGISCIGFNNGSIKLENVTGGSSPYSYSFNEGGITSFGSPVSFSNLLPGTYTLRAYDDKSCASDVVNIIITDPVQLNANFTLENPISCFNGNNGKVLAQATGGTGMYPTTGNYIWTKEGSTYTYTGQNPTNLSAGKYFVKVKDNQNCENTISYDMPQPEAINATAAIDSITCNGAANAKISLNVTGGNPTYTYNWTKNDVAYAATKDLSSLAPGTYKVTITDIKNCTGVKSFFIGDPSLLAVDVRVGKAISCAGINDGEVDLQIITGKKPFTFAWTKQGDGNFSNSNQSPVGLSTGTYNVVVKDKNNCSTNASVSLNEPPALQVSANAVATSCFSSSDGKISVSVAGGTPNFTYDWGTSGVANVQNPTGLPAGQYNVKVTDAKGCISNASVAVSAPTEIVVTSSISSPTDNQSNGAIDISVVGGQPPYTYKWDHGVISQDLSNLVGGEYRVEVKDSKECIAFKTISLTVTGINEQDFVEKYLIYPNPASEFLQIDAIFKAYNNANIHLVNMMGVHLLSLEKGITNKINHQVDLSKYPSGLYILILEIDGNQLSRKVFISK